MEGPSSDDELYARYLALAVKLGWNKQRLEELRDGATETPSRPNGSPLVMVTARSKKRKARIVAAVCSPLFSPDIALLPSQDADAGENDAPVPVRMVEGLRGDGGCSPLPPSAPTVRQEESNRLSSDSSDVVLVPRRNRVPLLPPLPATGGPAPPATPAPAPTALPVSQVDPSSSSSDDVVLAPRTARKAAAAGGAHAAADAVIPVVDTPPAAGPAVDARATAPASRTVPRAGAPRATGTAPRRLRWAGDGGGGGSAAAAVNPSCTPPLQTAQKTPGGRRVLFLECRSPVSEDGAGSAVRAEAAATQQGRQQRSQTSHDSSPHSSGSSSSDENGASSDGSGSSGGMGRDRREGYAYGNDEEEDEDEGDDLRGFIASEDDDEDEAASERSSAGSSSDDAADVTASSLSRSFSQRLALSGGGSGGAPLPSSLLDGSLHPTTGRVVILEEERAAEGARRQLLLPQPVGTPSQPRCKGSGSTAASGPAGPADAPSGVRYLRRQPERDALTAALFSEYNRTVFKSLLPPDLTIEWGPRLTRTAGLTYTRAVPAAAAAVSASQGGGVGASYVARIVLSTKVLTSSWKLAQTLLHEMCHAAAWIVDHTNRPPHGAAFKRWGACRWWWWRRWGVRWKGGLVWTRVAWAAVRAPVPPCCVQLRVRRQRTPCVR
jgi:hypothetical protein